MSWAFVFVLAGTAYFFKVLGLVIIGDRELPPMLSRCLALIPAALELPALVSLVLVTAVCCALIAWDVIHYREDRAEVRRARP